MKYYNWRKTFSYQTGTQGEFFLGLGAKDIGKTFGLRAELTLRFLNTGKRFCEVCRTREEADAVAVGYLDKIIRDKYFDGEKWHDFSMYRYKANKGIGYIGKVGFDDDGNEVVKDWQAFVYFIALTMFQTVKKRTFDNVFYFIFDEAIIDRKDKHHRYLTNEYAILANIIDTVLREDWENPKGAKVYLLGNSCDLLCPYLRGLGVSTLPKFGYSFYRDKQTLVHYIEPEEVDERLEHTLVGRMLQGSDEARLVFNNEFVDDTDEYIERRPSAADFKFGIRYLGASFGVWLDWQKALFYIEGKIPKNHQSQTLALTRADNSIDYRMASRTNESLQILVEAFYLQSIRYDSPATRELFFQLLGYFGIA